MAELLYQATIIDGKSSLIVFNGEKCVTVSEAQVIEWHDEIERKRRELYPSVGFLVSEKVRETAIRSKIQQLFE